MAIHLTIDNCEPKQQFVDRVGEIDKVTLLILAASKEYYEIVEID